MRLWQRFDRSVAMANRWRRRTVCAVLADGHRHAVTLRAIDGNGAQLDIAEPPALGAQIELIHPHAGTIAGRVTDIGNGTIRVGFDRSEGAIAYALAAIAADMTFD